MNTFIGKNGTGTSTLIKSETACESMEIKSEIEFEFINVKQERVDELSEVDLHLDNANQMDTCTDNTQTEDPEWSMNEMSQGEIVSDIKVIYCAYDEVDVPCHVKHTVK
jgi:predicted ATP-binding protein involved in virulence